MYDVYGCYRKINKDLVSFDSSIYVARKLYIKNTKIQHLICSRDVDYMELPDTLKTLYYPCHITTKLPDGLEQLNCSSILQMPKSLKKLECNSFVGEINEGMEYLQCRIDVPTIPKSLLFLGCNNYNQSYQWSNLISLSLHSLQQNTIYVPSSLQYLYIKQRIYQISLSGQADDQYVKVIGADQLKGFTGVGCYNIINIPQSLFKLNICSASDIQTNLEDTNIKHLRVDNIGDDIVFPKNMEKLQIGVSEDIDLQDYSLIQLRLYTSRPIKANIRSTIQKLEIINWIDIYIDNKNKMVGNVLHIDDTIITDLILYRNIGGVVLPETIINCDVCSQVMNTPKSLKKLKCQSQRQLNVEDTELESLTLSGCEMQYCILPKTLKSLQLHTVNVDNINCEMCEDLNVLEMTHANIKDLKIPQSLEKINFCCSKINVSNIKQSNVKIYKNTQSEVVEMELPTTLEFLNIQGSKKIQKINTKGTNVMCLICDCPDIQLNKQIQVLYCNSVKVLDAEHTQLKKLFVNNAKLIKVPKTIQIINGNYEFLKQNKKYYKKTNFSPMSQQLTQKSIQIRQYQRSLLRQFVYVGYLQTLQTLNAMKKINILNKIK